MEIRQLKIFLKVCELNNFTAAAKNLNYSQSTISETIMSLEKVVGRQLFERLNRKIYITEDGQNLKKHAEKLLLIYNDTMASFGEPNKRTINVGITESLCSYRFPGFFRDFLQDHTNISIIFTIARCDEIPELIRQNKIDVGFTLDDILGYKHINTEVLFDEEIVFIKSTQYNKKTYNTLKDLNKENVVASQGYAGYNKIYLDLYHDENIDAGNFIYMESIEGIKSYVKGGFGISFIPLTTVEKDLEEGSLEIMKFSDERYYHQVKIVTHKDKYMSIEIEQLIASAISKYKKIEV